ncbi:MAG: nucleotidyl transferase AbiEii/AbiGii toxin family protein [Gemmatimonadota bacterium]|nr:nucleotidyl transferase AbiEii/AbiGii toxin family protein [Gemmatimonadota bacterium]
MRISPEKLAAEAEATGFRADMLEKAVRLLALLEAMRSHPFLKGKLVLKGGTALNLFVFDVPRLSVDIDLNYVGTRQRDAVLEERPRIEKAVQDVFRREDFAVRRMPEEHAGGKWSLRYQSASGPSGNLDVDINFMYRVPLWPVATMDSRSLGSWKVTDIPVMDVHELAAGKLSALVARRRARDLFDSRLIFSMEDLDRDRLRIAFVVYGAMDRKDWRRISVADVDLDVAELAGQLVPALHAGAIQGPEEATTYGEMLVRECRQGISTVLPFTDAEGAFLDLLLEKGEIDASILTDDRSLQIRIQSQPLLEWKALNVRRHKGLF